MIIPYLYNYYGSSNSLDKDVVIMTSLPCIEEDKKRLSKHIKDIYGLDWNINMVNVIDGIVTDCIHPKSSIDSINNSLFYTYNNHIQDCEILVDRPVKRNLLLATYKTVRVLSANLTKTHFRPLIRPLIRGMYGILYLR